MKTILIVEGNTKENNLELVSNNIETHTQSIHNSLNRINENLEIDEFNPSIKNNLNKLHLEKYDGLIWSGGNGHIYENDDDTKAQIEFMKICFKKVKNIFAICWGMQVAVKAAGGEVKKSNNGPNIGVSLDIKLTDEGKTHPMYKDKNNTFSAPAFNFDEVVKLPLNTKYLSFNSINKFQSVSFECDKSNVWAVQYHPEFDYDKMINLTIFKKKTYLKMS
jgi:GMP synthase (glutamine-hydrolysing)